MKKIMAVTAFLLTLFAPLSAKARGGVKPRVIISTDIGGTDPDDNQSFIHLMMMSDMFDIKGLISSPSFGNGSKEELLRMIDIYSQDYPKLKAKIKDIKSPDELKLLCKQGRHGLADLRGWGTPTEGSDWIIKEARKKDKRPLWILGWGTLEDVAQALHDAPDIKDKIRVYWIGGPNKKWGVNSYSYIASNFPDLWMIESNATYRGFISDSKNDDRYNNGYYDWAIRGCGSLGEDFINYYKGIVKMGDTPSLLYLMYGDSDNPEGEHWGGSFVKIDHSSKSVITKVLTKEDEVSPYCVMEFIFKGSEYTGDKTKPCFTLTIQKQVWDGYYTGDGTYMVRYSPKAPGVLSYVVQSDKVSELNDIKGEFTVTKIWPGKASDDDYKLKGYWYSDNPDESLFRGNWQGVGTISKWRSDILDQWKERWDLLK